MKSLRETYGISGSLGIYGGSLRGRHHSSNLGGPGTATQGDGSTDGSASEPDGPMGSGGTGGMSNTSGGTVLAMSDNDEMMDLDKQKRKKDMQFEAWVDNLVKDTDPGIHYNPPSPDVVKALEELSDGAYELMNDFCSGDISYEGAEDAITKFIRSAYDLGKGKP